MKTLLLNPAVDFDKQFGTLEDFYTPIPALGLAYVGAALRQQGFNVEGLDSFIQCHTIDEMYEHILASSPDVLGISLLTPAAPLVDRLLMRLRRKMPSLVVIMGNLNASVFDQYYLSERLADYIVHHEGEATMAELMLALREGKSVESIKGISYLDHDGRVVKTPRREWIERIELDKMPYPAWDLFPVHQFKPDIRMLGGTKANKAAQVQALPILASRGCPQACTFCSPVNTIGRRYFMRSPKSVVDEMEYFYRKWGTTMFYYMDLTFPLSEKLGIEFCDELIARELPILWMCETRVSSVTLPLLKKMKESGCMRIDYGIEAGNQKMLDSIRKNFTIEQVRNATRWTREAGIEQEGLFIIGLPNETVQDTRDTINFALSLDQDHIKLNIFVPYPGSEAYDKLNESGELRNFNFDQYTSYPVYNGGAMSYVPPGRTADELMRMQAIGMRKAMFRKRVILRELRHFKLDKIHQYVHAIRALILPGGERRGKDATVDRMHIRPEHRTVKEIVSQQR
jgi:magnesium-protoporphyrin IX monomethyl ester (oxidative) cyclase